jgi:hypothetical protein
MKTYGEIEIQLYVFLTAALDVGEETLTPDKEPRR